MECLSLLNGGSEAKFLRVQEQARAPSVRLDEQKAMEGSGFRARQDVVEETMKLAREYRERPVFETQHVIAAALVGFALALLLGPRPRD